MTTAERPARRTFLKHLAALGAVGGSGWVVHTWPKTVAAQPAPPEPRQMGCFTRPWGKYEYRVASDAIAKAGFRHVGLMSTKPKDDAPWALIITAATTTDEARQVGQEAGWEDPDRAPARCFRRSPIRGQALGDGRYLLAWVKTVSGSNHDYFYRILDQFDFGRFDPVTP